ncbi:MAG: HAD family phosphatase [Elusimicrobia bacterium]|nr:HAD family phosphatase [Elusimicrobiota bacterium]
MKKGPPAVFFDIGNVLLRVSAKQAVRRIAWAVGHHPLKVARYFFSSDIVDEIERGTIEPQELYERFRSELDYKGSFPEFNKLWCGYFRLDRKGAYALKAVAELHPTYLLSNTNYLHYEFIKSRYGFAGQVDGAVLSYELGLRKPEPAIYHAALKLAGVAPDQAVYIDDIKENVEAARKVGITAILNRPCTNLRRELSKLGVL